MEELKHKSFNLKEACADFVSQGWKFIHPESLEVVNDYKLATFKKNLKYWINRYIPENFWWSNIGIVNSCEICENIHMLKHT